MTTRTWTIEKMLQWKSASMKMCFNENLRQWISAANLHGGQSWRNISRSMNARIHEHLKICFNEHLRQWQFASMEICVNENLLTRKHRSMNKKNYTNTWKSASMKTCVNENLCQLKSASMTICVNEYLRQWKSASMNILRQWISAANQHVGQSWRNISRSMNEKIHEHLKICFNENLRQWKSASMKKKLHETLENLSVCM